MDGLNLKYAKFLDDALTYDKQRDADLTDLAMEAVAGMLMVNFTEEDFEWFKCKAGTPEPEPRELLRLLKEDAICNFTHVTLVAMHHFQVSVARAFVESMKEAGAPDGCCKRDFELEGWRE